MRGLTSLFPLLPALAALLNIISVTFALTYHIFNEESGSQLVTTNSASTDPPIFLTEPSDDHGDWSEWRLFEKDESTNGLQNIHTQGWLSYPYESPDYTPVASKQYASELQALYITDNIVFFLHKKSGLYLTEVGADVKLTPASNSFSQMWNIHQLEPIDPETAK